VGPRWDTHKKKSPTLSPQPAPPSPSHLRRRTSRLHRRRHPLHATTPPCVRRPSMAPYRATVPSGGGGGEEQPNQIEDERRRRRGLLLLRWPTGPGPHCPALRRLVGAVCARRAPRTPASGCWKQATRKLRHRAAGGRPQGRCGSMLLCVQRDCDAACGAEEAGTTSRRRRAAAPRRPGGDRFLEMGMELSPVRWRLIFFVRLHLWCGLRGGFYRGTCVFLTQSYFSGSNASNAYKTGRRE
jgi:hypothetical protein